MNLNKLSEVRRRNAGNFRRLVVFPEIRIPVMRSMLLECLQEMGMKDSDLLANPRQAFYAMVI